MTEKNDKKNIVVATIHDWNVELFNNWKPPSGFQKFLISRKEDLTIGRLQELQPRYIFFPHWSWMIPSRIYEEFECVVFHMTDVPFGRGGSPLQNLISRGIYQTKVSAIRVAKDVDAGAVYMKRPFSIKEGSAEKLYKSVSQISCDMMDAIVQKNPQPKPQQGKVVIFQRRTPEDSRIPKGLSGRKLYDFIRMLDAPGYPHAFIEHDGYRMEFQKARLEKDGVSADIVITGV